jgi:hypothetical protein
MRRCVPVHLQLLSARVLVSALGGRLPVPIAAQSASCTAARMSAADIGAGVDNLQLGSRLAGPGQQQLRIEADYVTCTQ